MERDDRNLNLHPHIEELSALHGRMKGYRVRPTVRPALAAPRPAQPQR